LRVSLSIVVPTFNESGNISELTRRIHESTGELDAELIFVDDSTDDTPEVIRALPAFKGLVVRLIHRDTATGGLGGAVVEGMRGATHDVIVVMDGDLQHPPELIAVLAAAAEEDLVDLVVATRYTGDGDAAGLASSMRRAVSSLSTALTRAMFPSRLRDCSDPMTGFFLVKRSRIRLADLQPRGFKILLEIIARQPRRLNIVEEPFTFGSRYAGKSKATLTQGLRFVRQLVALRFGRMSRFAVIGGLGAIANVGIVAALTGWGVEYLVAAAIAAEVTIVANYFLQERFVFRDLAAAAGTRVSRFIKSFAFNNIEAALRVPLLFVFVDYLGVAAVPATAITLVIAFVARFMFHSLVIYAPPRTARPLVGRPADERPSSVGFDTP
jgi:dolichol-phosphate mannosyltransferase